MVQTSSPIEIGQRIRRLRREQNFTQEEIAQKMNVTRATINKYEAGIVNFPRNRIEQLATILGVSPAYILGWTNDRSADYKPAKARPLFDPNSSQARTAEAIAAEKQEQANIVQAYAKQIQESGQLIPLSPDELKALGLAPGMSAPIAQTDPNLDELIRIYKALNIKDRNKLLSFAYELEDKTDARSNIC